MCGFKPGDEVVALDQETEENDLLVVTDGYIAPGTVCVVEKVFFIGPYPLMWLVGYEGYSWQCRDFRKVERKTDRLSLTEWLSQPAGDTDNLDKPIKQPAKVRERG